MPPEDGGGFVRISQPPKRAPDGLAGDRLVGRRGRRRRPSRRARSPSRRSQPRCHRDRTAQALRRRGARASRRARRRRSARRGRASVPPGHRPPRRRARGRGSAPGSRTGRHAAAVISDPVAGQPDSRGDEIGERHRAEPLRRRGQPARDARDAAGRGADVEDLGGVAEVDVDRLELGPRSRPSRPARRDEEVEQRRVPAGLVDEHEAARTEAGQRALGRRPRRAPRRSRHRPRCHPRATPRRRPPRLPDGRRRRRPGSRAGHP